MPIIICIHTSKAAPWLTINRSIIHRVPRVWSPSPRPSPPSGSRLHHPSLHLSSFACSPSLVWYGSVEQDVSFSSLFSLLSSLFPASPVPVTFEVFLVRFSSRFSHCRRSLVATPRCLIGRNTSHGPGTGIEETQTHECCALPVPST